MKPDHLEKETKLQPKSEKMHYTSPKLVEYGSISQLTQGGPGTVADAAVGQQASAG